jgi:hypothetical protein
VAVLIILKRSRLDISSLSEMMTGILSKALMTMKRGIKVKTNELIRLLIARLYHSIVMGLYLKNNAVCTIIV